MKRPSMMTITILCAITVPFMGDAMDEKKKIARKNETSSINGHVMKVSVSNEPSLTIGNRKLTIGQAIDSAIRHDATILMAAHEAAMADTNYKMFRKKFDPVLAAGVDGLYAGFPPSQNIFAGLNRSSVSGNASVFKNFESGTTVAGGVMHEWHDTTRKTGLSGLLSSMMGPPVAHTPAVFISIQQQLLNNSFGINDRKLDRIMKNATHMQKDAIEFQISLIAVGVIGDYWALVLDKTAMANAELQVQETQKVRDIAARNASYGMAMDYTVNMYNAMLAGAKAKHILAKKKFIESRRRLLTNIDMDENMEVASETVFSDSLPAVDPQKDLESAYRNRVDYQNAVLSLENAKMASKIASNSTLPSLVLEVNAKSSGENRNLAGSYGEIARFQYPVVEGKIKMTYPLGDMDRNIQERNARFRLKQAELQLHTCKRQVRDDVMNASNNIEAMYWTYQNAMEARKKSELFHAGMLRDLRLGRLNSAIVKNSLDALVESREGELKALVGYNVALLQYDVALNRLFEKYRIDVKKYVPDDKKKKMQTRTMAESAKVKGGDSANP